MSKPRNMSRLYRLTKTADLRELQSRKKVMLRRLEKSLSWIDQQERKRIEFNLRQIEVELASRRDQMDLF